MVEIFTWWHKDYQLVCFNKPAVNYVALYNLASKHIALLLSYDAVTLNLEKSQTSRT